MAKPSVSTIVFALLLGFVLPGVCWAQVHDHPHTEIAQPPPEDEEHARIERERQKQANLERQHQLKRDTDELFKLATELKQYVDKTNENVLSLEVIHKADEIEKLAHSVREKMKGN